MVSSRSRLRRPIFSAMLERIEAGEAQGILIQKIDQGIYLMPRTLRAVELAKEHGVTLRTSYRWIKREENPKPAKHTHSPRTDLWRELRFARAALRRAERIAESSWPIEEEMALLEKISGFASVILAKWRGWT